MLRQINLITMFRDTNRFQFWNTIDAEEALFKREAKEAFNKEIGNLPIMCCLHAGLTDWVKRS